jgi:competence protein ComEC
MQRPSPFLAILLIALHGSARADYVEVSRPATVKAAADRDATILLHVDDGDTFVLAQSGQENGYYKVQLQGGGQGWIYRTLVRRFSGDPPGTPANPGGTPPAQPFTGSFQIHFLDVGTGDSAIIDMGDREIVIDGGDSVRVLHDYAARTGVIDGPIELVVVTHGDSDHWKGLTRLLGFDGQGTATHPVLEFWEPGFDRDCSPLPAYSDFIADVSQIPGIVFRRPLEVTFPPATTTLQPTPIQLPTLPGVVLTVLSTERAPETSNGDCAYKINNASIVLRIDIGGHRFLFTGDANGKERDEASPGTPGHIEKQLLDLEHVHPGTLKADLIKVPHHGSETASTQALINAVDPKFVIISASTKHHLPKDTTVQRYVSNQRVILRTDAHPENDVDHIVCGLDGNQALDCNFASVLVP